MGNQHILTADGLRKSFGKGQARVDALQEASLRVGRGEFLAVMGPSGSGKSTLLHVLGLMTPPDAGRIEIDGQVVNDSDATRGEIRRKRIGFVFQRFNLLGVLSAADNVAISLRVRGIKPDGRIKPSQMSIGEQQRVAVVRAIAHQPAILLADEPTGNLDSANAAALLELFAKTNRDAGQTTIMITHSPEVAGYADRALHMTDGVLTDG